VDNDGERVKKAEIVGQWSVKPACRRICKKWGTV